MCGGIPDEVFRRIDDRGLSPRVRGNRALTCTWTDPPGSIPACAGESWRRSASTRSARVYPRVCGGIPLWPHQQGAIVGLSPRVRGNRWPAGSSSENRWSIPACAGESRRPRRWRCQAPVYPRVCGGISSSTVNFRHLRGLSPRVRGNRVAVVMVAIKKRSIPACAGESC